MSRSKRTERGRYVRGIRGQGGCIIISAAGEVACPFISTQMVRGWVVDRERPTVAILPGEALVISEDFE